jgi:hypothetical protein
MPQKSGVSEIDDIFSLTQAPPAEAVSEDKGKKKKKRTKKGKKDSGDAPSLEKNDDNIKTGEGKKRAIEPETILDPSLLSALPPKAKKVKRAKEDSQNDGAKISGKLSSCPSPHFC